MGRSYFEERTRKASLVHFCIYLHEGIESVFARKKQFFICSCVQKFNLKLLAVHDDIFMCFMVHMI